MALTKITGEGVGSVDSITVTDGGSIGSDGSDLVIDGPSGHTGLRMTTSGLLPRQNGAIIDNTIDLGSGAYRYNDLYLGGNLYLGGTGSANALSDYEEGNFTVTISSGISVSSYDHQLGHYVKVGRQVTAWVFMEYNGSSRTGSHFIISGLPFNSSDDNTTESTFGGFIGYQNGFSNTNNIVHVPRGTNIIQFYEVDGSTLIGSELSGASGEIRVVVQYTVP